MPGTELSISDFTPADPLVAHGFGTALTWRITSTAPLRSLHILSRVSRPGPSVPIGLPLNATSFGTRGLMEATTFLLTAETTDGATASASLTVLVAAPDRDFRRLTVKRTLYVEPPPE
ncbi:hypothetical protein ABTZ03_28565 [Kitasatospora sp. NPDC096077]|uniref:hypothetical protein n=1 Tax=Kitasatospora sp. NPDC096077 TaxID=3155544 RepID=UPI00332D79FC